MHLYSRMSSGQSGRMSLGQSGLVALALHTHSVG